jgi:lipopolysaccharide/colanic/teichoic acid biosynthesis glycosyltransferase
MSKRRVADEPAPAPEGLADSGDVRVRLQRGWQLWAKRAFDCGVALGGILLLSPVFLVCGLLIWVSEGRPILFRQERPGRLGKPFVLYKFTTMSQERDFAGNLLSDALRLTYFGRILRSLSLDELPQLWNILCGDMSLVGPRPLLPQYLPRYTVHQRRRHEVLPGITGWAQVNGRNALSWEEKFKLDVWYVDHWSLWLDLRILFVTVFKVLHREGIAQAGQATMPEFMGK